MKYPMLSLWSRRSLATVLLALALAVLSARAARGSSVVPPRHLGELAQMSEAVVLARAGASSAFARGGLILTRTSFEVMEVVRGAVLRRQQIDVETYGGVLGTVGWSVAGSPQFEPDTVYLLFLSRRGAAWQPRLLAYGLLEQIAGADGSMLLTHVRQHHDLALLRRPDGAPTEPVGTYYALPLLRHLRQVVTARAAWDGSRAAAPEALHPPAHDAAGKAATFPEPCEYMTYSGFPIRWNSFDNNVTVSVFAEAGGDNDVGGDAEFTAVQQSLNAWNNIAGVNVDYHWGGPEAYTPDCSDGDAAPDDVAPDQGLIQFNDPCDEIPDLANCSGTLALGGSFFSVGPGGRHTHRGMEWNTNLVGFVIINNGVGACLSTGNYRIMMTHELGHTLGLAHIPSARGAANMNPSCCTDITNIDETCTLFSYSNQPFETAPGEITLIAPQHDAQDEPLSPELTWRADSNADVYHLQVSTNSGFTQLVYENAGLTQPTQAVGPLAGFTRHYWRVRGINGVGAGPWSGTFRFTTIRVLPGEATLIAPRDGAVDQPTTVMLHWQQVPAADQHQLQVSTNSGFTQLVFEDAAVTQTRREVGPLDHRTTFFWRVRGVNASGQGAWSPTWSLTTLPALPGAITLTAPEADAVEQPVVLPLAWQAEPNAAAYHLQVSTAEDFSEIVFEADTLAQTTHEVGPLVGATEHAWRVRGVNAAGAGPWSAVRRFTTALVAPDAVALTAPEDGVVEQPAEVTLAWEADLNADVYHLQVSTAEDFSEIVFEADTLAQTAHEVGPLAGATEHAWRVRGVNAVGAGPWSAVRRFTTALFAPGLVVLTAPEDGAVDLPGIVPFAWEADLNADAYHLQVSTAEDFSEIVFEDEGLAQTTQDVGPLAYSTEHVWRVRGVNVGGAGPWSAVRRFTVAVGTAVEQAGEGVPGAYRLYQNYPNPFNPQTALRFDLPAASEVTLAVYDVLGRMVETLVSGTLPAGRYTFAWEAGDHPSGLYLARLQAGPFSQTRRMLLLK